MPCTSTAARPKMTLSTCIFIDLSHLIAYDWNVGYGTVGGEFDRLEAGASAWSAGGRDPVLRRVACRPRQQYDFLQPLRNRLEPVHSVSLLLPVGPVRAAGRTGRFGHYRRRRTGHRQ